MMWCHSKMGKKIQRNNISCIRKSKRIKRKESSLMEETKFYYILGRKLTRKGKTGYSRLKKPEPIKTLFQSNVDMTHYLLYYVHLLPIGLQRFLGVNSAKF